jgi:hypothetical protein
MNVFFSLLKRNVMVVMEFNVTFNNIKVISWWSVVLVEETTDLPQVTDKLYHIMLYRVNLACAGFELTTFVVIGTEKNSWKHNGKP